MLRDPKNQGLRAINWQDVFGTDKSNTLPLKERAALVAISFRQSGRHSETAAGILPRDCGGSAASLQWALTGCRAEQRSHAEKFADGLHRRGKNL